MCVEELLDSYKSSFAEIIEKTYKSYGMKKFKNLIENHLKKIDYNISGMSVYLIEKENSKVLVFEIKHKISDLLEYFKSKKDLEKEFKMRPYLFEYLENNPNSQYSLEGDYVSFKIFLSNKKDVIDFLANVFYKVDYDKLEKKINNLIDKIEDDYEKYYESYYESFYEFLDERAYETIFKKLYYIMNPDFFINSKLLFYYPKLIELGIKNVDSVLAL